MFDTTRKAKCAKCARSEPRTVFETVTLGTPKDEKILSSSVLIIPITVASVSGWTEVEALVIGSTAREV